MKKQLLKRFARTFLIVVIVAVLWEAGFRAGFISPIIFGSPSLVLRAAMTDYATFIPATQVTVMEIACALAISWPLGVALGAITGRDPFLNAVAQPLISAMIAVPLVILYPLFVVWFGLGMASKIAFGVVLGTFPVASNAAIGIRAVERGYLDAAVAMGATRFQVIWQVMIPLSIPTVLNGLRLGSSLVIAGVVLAEMLSATDGLGYLISSYRTLFATGHVYLGILLTLLIAAIVNGGLALLDARFGARDSSSLRIEQI